MSFTNLFNKKAAKNIARVVLPLVLVAPMVVAPQKVEAGWLPAYMIYSSGSHDGGRRQPASYYELNKAMTDLSVSKSHIEKAFEGRNIIRLENLDTCRTEVGVPDEVAADARQELAENIRSCLRVHDTKDALGAEAAGNALVTTRQLYWKGNVLNLSRHNVHDVFQCRQEHGLPGQGAKLTLTADQARDIFNCMVDKQSQRSDERLVKDLKIVGGIVGGSMLVALGGAYLASRRRKKTGNAPKR